MEPVGEYRSFLIEDSFWSQTLDWNVFSSIVMTLEKSFTPWNKSRMLYNSNIPKWKPPTLTFPSTYRSAPPVCPHVDNNCNRSLQNRLASCIRFVCPYTKKSWIKKDYLATKKPYVPLKHPSLLNLYMALLMSNGLLDTKPFYNIINSLLTLKTKMSFFR